MPLGGGTNVPSGAASGDLTGSYPSPTIGAVKVTAAKLASGAAASGTILTANGIGGVGYLAPAVAAGQTAISDLNLGSLTLLTDVITALGTVQTKVNLLLAELRSSGLLTP
jgi:hypothetical protein